MIGSGVTGEEEVSGKECGGNGLVNEGNESSTIRIGKMVLTSNGVVGEGYNDGII